MDQSPAYRIRVQGRLGPEWSAWFSGLLVESRTDGTTTLTGPLADQAALHGLLGRIRDLGLTLVGVETVQEEGTKR